MHLAGYWMERGFDPDRFFSMSCDEKAVWMAIADLNSEKRIEDMKSAFIDALLEVLKSMNRR